MMRFSYVRPDGGVSIVTSASLADMRQMSQFSAMTAEEHRAHVVARAIPGDAIDVMELPDDWQPPDRAFRNAWRLNAGTFDIDMTHAREIHRDRLRKLRSPMLAALDIEMSRAYNRSPAIRDVIEAKRQALRDVTQDPMIDAALTPDELKYAIPDILKG